MNKAVRFAYLAILLFPLPAVAATGSPVPTAALAAHWSFLLNGHPRPVRADSEKLLQWSVDNPDDAEAEFIHASLINHHLITGNIKEANVCIDLSASKKYEPSMASLADSLLFGTNRKSNPKLGKLMIEDLVHSNKPFVELICGNALVRVGLTSQEAAQQTEALLKHAIENGATMAAVPLAKLYAQEYRSADAMELLRAAAGAGNPIAEGELATWYVRGLCVPVNSDEAFRWMSRAVDSGGDTYSDLLCVFGQFYEHGVGTAVDKKRAVALYEQAYALDNETAGLLAVSLYAEIGSPAQDVSKGLVLCRKLAEAGNVRAETLLGETYLAGIIVPRDVPQARIWFERAAKDGDPEAANTLKLMDLSTGSSTKPTDAH